VAEIGTELRCVASRSNRFSPAEGVFSIVKSHAGTYRSIDASLVPMTPKSFDRRFSNVTNPKPLYCFAANARE